MRDGNLTNKSFQAPNITVFIPHGYFNNKLSSEAVEAVARNSFCVLLLRSKFSFSAEASACLYRLDDYPFITMRFHSATRRLFIEKHQSILLDCSPLLLSL